MAIGIKSAAKELTQADKYKVIEKLTTARIGLLLRHPFFGNMATRLTLEDASNWCKTIATDGRKFYYNNEFVLKLTPKATEFGFAHEILHNVFEHMLRRGTRDPDISNIAADYAVNQICHDDKIGEFPNFMKVYYDPKYKNWSYEQIYDHILDDYKTLAGQLFDDHIDPEKKMTPEEIKQIRDEIKEAMISAAQTAGLGKLSDPVRRLISSFTEPKMDWRELLRMNIESMVRSDFSFARYNKKSQHCGVIFPGMTSAQSLSAAVAIDTSGSISSKQTNDFLSEVKGIMDQYEEFKLDVWCFDDFVHNHQTFTHDTSADILDYKVMGGMGTNFESNFNFMKENEIEPKKFVMFTDGYPGSTWGDPDYCDTLFVIHGSETITAPYGQTTYYK